MAHPIQRIEAALAPEPLDEASAARKALLALLGAATIGGGSLAHGQEVRRAQPVTPRAELVTKPTPEPTPDSPTTHVDTMPKQVATPQSAFIPDVAEAIHFVMRMHAGITGPLSCVIEPRATGKTVDGKAQWEALFKDKDGDPVGVVGHGYTITNMGGEGLISNKEQTHQAQEAESDTREAIIQLMMQQHKMTHDEAEQAFAKQPDYWTQWAQQPIPGENIQNMPNVFTQREPPTQAQIITARRKLAAQQAAEQAKTQAARQETERNQRVLQQAGITVDGVRNLIRQAIAARSGTPVGNYPMVKVGLYATGKMVDGEPEWEAIFSCYGDLIEARGHGTTVTDLVGGYDL